MESINNIVPSENQSAESIQKDDFADQYRKILKENISQGYYGDERETNEEINSRVEGELSLMQDILEMTKKAQDENPEKEIILLCDIDETLVNRKYCEDGKQKDFLRPCLSSLFKSLKEVNIKIGVLTNRKTIKEQIENDKELRVLKECCDENNIYSSREFFNQEELKKDERIVSFEKKDDKGFTSGDLEKIAFLDKLFKNNPEKIFIPVDDLKYPAIYKYGIALKNNQKFVP